MDRPRRLAAARFGVLIIALSAGIVLCWMLLTPPGAGPDEPGHLTRAGGLARGQLDGMDVGRGRWSGFELPLDYVLPEPGCYAFHPEVPANCAPQPVSADDEVVVLSTATEYPIWGHLPGGLFSRLPGLEPIWWARIGGGLVAVGLVAAALVLAARRRGLASTSLLVALTPMSWSTFSVVNPSGMAISGAVALWAALVYGDGSRTSRWTAALGWAALVLPRRDGLVWACIALVVALSVSGRTLIGWARSLGLWPAAVVAMSTAATVAWGLTTDSRSTQLLVLAPIALVGVEFSRSLWRTRASTLWSRVGVVVIGVGSLLLVAGALAIGRPGGWDADLAGRIIDETGNNLVEAIGLLGWLDTSLPVLAVVGVCAAVGVLAAASLAMEMAPAVWAVAVVAIAIVTSWLFEFAQGSTSGTYWQGRYSIPLLVGAPILLGSSRAEPGLARRILVVSGGLSLVVLNVAAWGAARRWGVGDEGSLWPWDWNTWNSPVPTVAVLLALAVLSAVLGAALWRGIVQPSTEQSRA